MRVLTIAAAAAAAFAAFAANAANLDALREQHAEMLARGANIYGSTEYSSF